MERGVSAALRAPILRLIPISAEELHALGRLWVGRFLRVVIHPEVSSLTVLLVGLLVETISPMMLLKVVILVTHLGMFLPKELLL